jgi:hypothetical protein
MRKIEASETLSNLLMATSVTLAFTPLLLGDQLFLVVTEFLTEGSVILDQLSTYLTRLVS